MFSEFVLGPFKPKDLPVFVVTLPFHRQLLKEILNFYSFTYFTLKLLERKLHKLRGTMVFLLNSKTQDQSGLQITI